MAYRVRFSDEAKADLLSIYEYYDGTKHVRAFDTHWLRLAERLKVLPRSGVLFGVFRKVVVLKRYSVIYRIVSKREVEVARVFDGRTDYHIEGGRKR